MKLTLRLRPKVLCRASSLPLQHFVPAFAYGLIGILLEREKKKNGKTDVKLQPLWTFAE